MKRKEYRKTGWFLLLLFSLYWCGITLFVILHMVCGGHLHPYRTGHVHTGVQHAPFLFVGHRFIGL